MKLKDLPVGKKVREQRSGLVFLVADHHHCDWPCTTLLADNVVKLASFDAAEPDSPNKWERAYGNNNYPLSNIHKWLNSAEADWYAPTHIHDRPPENEGIAHTDEYFYEDPAFCDSVRFRFDMSYRKDAGFLSWFSEDFVNAIVRTRIPCTVIDANGMITQPNLLAGVFLPSLCEVGCEYADPDKSGQRFPVFNDPRIRFCSPTPQACGKPDDYVYADATWWFLLRSPDLEYPGFVYRITPGYRGGDHAHLAFNMCKCYNASGIRPMINLLPDFPVSELPDADGVYSLIPPAMGIMPKLPKFRQGNISETLCYRPPVTGKIVPGCACTNSSCTRHGMCDQCWHYHRGPQSPFEPTCRLDHHAVSPQMLKSCYDDMGNLLKKFIPDKL